MNTLLGVRDGTYLVGIGSGLVMLAHPDAAVISPPFALAAAGRFGPWGRVSDTLNDRLALMDRMRTAVVVPLDTFHLDREAALKAWIKRRENMERNAEGKDREHPGVTLPPSMRAQRQPRRVRAEPAQAQARPATPHTPITQDVPVLAIHSHQQVGGHDFGNANETYRLDLVDGRRVVFKPASGEYMGARETTKKNKAFSLAEREVVAYRVQDALGLDLLPPTQLAQVAETTGAMPRGIGMMQGFIEKAGRLQLHEAYLNVSEGRTSEGRLTRAKIAVFDAIAANLDRHGKNWRFGKDGKFYAMDNGYTMGASPVPAPGRRGIRELRSWALARVRDGDMSTSTQRALASKIREVNWDAVLAGSHANEAERQTLKDRAAFVADHLNRGALHLVNERFKARGY